MKYKRVMFMHPVELSPGEVQSGFTAEKKDEATGEYIPNGVILTLEPTGMFRVDSGTSGRKRYVVEVPRENIKQAIPYVEERPAARGGK